MSELDKLYEESKTIRNLLERIDKQNHLLNIVLPNYQANYMTYEEQEEYLKSLKESSKEQPITKLPEPYRSLTFMLPTGMELVKEGDNMIISSKTTKTQILIAIINILAFIMFIVVIVRGFVR